MADLYSISVPVLVHYLGRLDGMLQRLADFASAEGRDEADLLARSLAEGMFDLRHQVLIAANFSIRTLRPISPSLGALPSAEADTIAGLRQRIAERIAALRRLEPAAINGQEAVLCREQAGDALVEADALAFVTRYALPNFLFHVVTAFAILRASGVPVGKADFDGFHAYPADFRFA